MQKKKNGFSAGKLEVFMRYFFIVLTFGAIILSIFQKQWEVLVSGFFTIILFMLPSLYSKKKNISIPPVFQIVILLFIFASMYLGEIHDYFYKYAWWDSMLHSVSAIILSYIGFLLIFTLNRDKNIHMRLSPFFIALFTFCFALTIGTLWEIFEFAVDALFGANMQKARNLEEIYGVFDTRLGVIDTMRDLIVDSIGALLVSVIAYYYSKKKMVKESTFWKMKDQFVEDNPDLFDN